MLVHQVDGRRHDESTDTGVGDGLQAEEGLPAASRKDDTAPPAVVDPGIEGGLLVVPRFDVERWCECEIGVSAGGIFNGADEPIAERGCPPSSVHAPAHSRSDW